MVSVEYTLSGLLGHLGPIHQGLDVGLHVPHLGGVVEDLHAQDEDQDGGVDQFRLQPSSLSAFFVSHRFSRENYSRFLHCATHAKPSP